MASLNRKRTEVMKPNVRFSRDAKRASAATRVRTHHEALMRIETIGNATLYLGDCREIRRRCRRWMCGTVRRMGLARGQARVGTPLSVQEAADAQTQRTLPEADMSFTRCAKSRTSRCFGAETTSLLT